MAKIGLLVIATGKYDQFIPMLYKSMKKYFLINHDVSMFVFTDQEIPNKDGLLSFYHQHEPWPNPTLKRYHVFDKYKEELSRMDYLYYCDADMRFVDVVGDEILGDLITTLHPGFWGKNNIQFSYERRPECKAYISYGSGNAYYAGGFNGGKSSEFLKMANTIVSWRKEDELNGLIPVWHDESYLNKYMYLNPPTKALTPSYCYPESWDLPFEKRLLALDKNHSEMRSL